MNQYDVSGILGNTGERENVKKEEIYIYHMYCSPGKRFLHRQNENREKKNKTEPDGQRIF